MGIMEHTKSQQGYPSRQSSHIGTNASASSNTSNANTNYTPQPQPQPQPQPRSRSRSPNYPQQLTGQLQQLTLLGSKTSNSSLTGQAQPLTRGGGAAHSAGQQRVPSPSPSVNTAIQNGTMTGTNGHVSSANSDAGSVTASASGDGANTPREERLVVGVDFGTTYSGVAAVYSGTPDEIEVIKSWPGGNGITSEKVPTEIGYAIAPGTSPDDPFAVKVTKWGFQFKPEEPRLRCIKLFLDRNQKLPHFVSPLETAAQLQKCGKTVMDAVSDYLTEIYKHTMETLTRRYGETFMLKTKVEFVLTVPAVWSDSAKNATLQAAERAGMGDMHQLKLISEPEAAAVYTLKAIQPNHLNVGDNFIVCDAGGGTVDLIAYKITALSPLKVEESAVGTGGLCGSAFLNYRFEDHVKTRVGEKVYNNMREKKAKTWNMGIKYFEEFIKRNFNDEEDQDMNVPFPGLPDDEEAGLDCGFLTMTTPQVKSIVDPVVQEVIGLVQGQVDCIRERGGHVSGIILVGGFGQSNYMYKQMKSHFNDDSPPPPYTNQPSHAHLSHQTQAIEVMHPMYAWTAVVRGAVIRGLEGDLVISRRSRMHYGTSYATIYDASLHPLKDRYWSPLWERWMVSDRMQWHIRKNEAVSESTPISFHYTRNFRPGQSLIVEDDLFACSEEVAPDASSGSGKEVVHVCTLITDLSVVPKSLFTRLTTTKGYEFDNLDFALDMRVQSAGLVFELKVDGVRYGAVEAKFH